VDFLTGFASLVALGGLVALWLAAEAVQLIVFERAMAGIARVLRAPLYLLDQAAGFWLFLASTAYRRQQLSVFHGRRGRERTAAIASAALAALCGLGLAAVLWRGLL
jgi:hypothetical protein